MNYVCEYEKVGRKLCSPTNFRNKEYIYKTKNVNRKFALVIQGNCMRNGRKIVQKINWKKLVRFCWFDDAKQLTGFFFLPLLLFANKSPSIWISTSKLYRATTF